jgi:hypothetical protein
MWDVTDVSQKDKSEMSEFCCEYFKGQPKVMADEREVIAVPIECLPPCFYKLFSETNFSILRNYFGYSNPLIAGVEIVKDPPCAQQQQTHASTSIGYGLSLTLEIAMEGFVTTFLIPGSHIRHRKEKNQQLIQPGIQQSKCAMVYDSSILHCYAGKNENVASFRLLIRFEKLLCKEMMNVVTPKYYHPAEEMINQAVLEFINKEMDHKIERYDFMALYKGQKTHAQQFTHALFGSSDDDSDINDMAAYLWSDDDGLGVEDSTQVCLSVSLSVSLSVCLSVGVSVCLSVGVSVCLSVCLSVYLPVSLFVFMSVCMCVCVSVCLCVCVSVCLCVCLCISFRI